MIALPLSWYTNPPSFWNSNTFQVRCQYPVDEQIDGPPVVVVTDEPIPIVSGEGKPSGFDLELLDERGVPIGSAPVPPNSKLTFSIALKDSNIQ